MEGIQEYIDDRLEFYQSELRELKGRYYKGIVPVGTSDCIWEEKALAAMQELNKISEMLNKSDLKTEGQRIIDWMCEDSHKRRMNIYNAVYMGVNNTLVKTKGGFESRIILHEGDIDDGVIQDVTFYEIVPIGDILG